MKYRSDKAINYTACTRVYLREVRRRHGKGHHGLLLLRIEGKRCIVICTILSSSLVGPKLLVLEALVSKVTSLIAIKVGLSIVRPIKAITAVSIVIVGPTIIHCPILCLIEGFLWSIIITAITATTVLVVVIVPSASGVTIPAIVSISATSTAP